MENRSDSRTLSFIILSVVAHIAIAAGVMTMNFQSEQKEESAPLEISAGSSLEVQEVSEAPVLAKETSLPVKATVAAPPTPKSTLKAVKTPKIPQTLPQAKAVAIRVAEEPMTQEESPVVVPVTQPVTQTEAEEQIEEQPEDTPAAVPVLLQAQEEAPAEEEMPAPSPLIEEIKETKQKENDADEKLGSIIGQGGDGSSPSEARNLESLRQIPGNKRPQYDREDQANGRQGQVSFKAYVSKEGAITDLQLAKSSGHRELDAKSLKAIKSWKFYPGQEGWVEIPFQWDLKGEPQQRSPIRSSSNGNQASKTE